MSIFGRLAETIVEGASNAFSATIEQVRTLFEGDPETRAKVAFSIALIALSAKMAKADGVVTEDEVDAFRDIFEIPPEEGERVSALYNLAKQDTAGFEQYAEQMRGLCEMGSDECPVLLDVLDGLFHIAKADNVVHERELEFLERVAEIFGLSSNQFDSVVARHVDKGASDPWRVLGIAPNVSFETAKKRYRQLAREHHPDALAARGVPEEFEQIANQRIAAINAAWETVEKTYKR